MYVRLVETVNGIVGRNNTSSRYLRCWVERDLFIATIRLLEASIRERHGRPQVSNARLHRVRIRMNGIHNEPR